MDQMVRIKDGLRRSGWYTTPVDACGWQNKNPLVQMVSCLAEEAIDKVPVPVAGELLSLTQKISRSTGQWKRVGVTVGFDSLVVVGGVIGGSHGWMSQAAHSCDCKGHKSLSIRCHAGGAFSFGSKAATVTDSCLTRCVLLVYTTDDRRMLPCPESGSQCRARNVTRLFGMDGQDDSDRIGTSVFLSSLQHEVDGIRGGSGQGCNLFPDKQPWFYRGPAVGAHRFRIRGEATPAPRWHRGNPLFRPPGCRAGFHSPILTVPGSGLWLLCCPVDE